jgi:hypothetical protein
MNADQKTKGKRTMMRTFKNLVGLALAAGLASAQLSTTNTTLTSAVSAGTGFNNAPVQWCLASAAGVVLPSLAAGTSGSILLADREAVQVLSQGATSLCFNVQRGALGTSANASHSTGTTVWVGSQAIGNGDTSRPFANGVFTSAWPSGSCARSAQYSLPIVFTGSSGVDTPAGALIDCVAGIWVNALPQINTVNSHSAFTTISPPNAIAANSTTDVNGAVFFSQMIIPAPSVLTGACLLNGATVGTDKRIFVLWDAAGNVVANTPTAGTTTATASKYQCVNFTSTVRVYGPMTYYVGIQSNGTTDTYSTYAANSAPNNYGTGTKAGTFGTAPGITPSLTFTANQGPIMMVY